MDIGFAMNYQYLNEINMTPNEEKPTWGWFGQGINSITPDKSETTSEEYYYDKFGDADTSVEGLSQSITVEGHRRLDDECQNFVADLEDETGDALYTQLRQTYPTGKVKEREITLHEIKAGQDGGPNEKAKFSCKLSFRGKPVVTDDGKSNVYPEKLTASDIEVGVGDTVQIDTTVEPSDANSRCVFATGNNKIATVSTDGVVTGVKAGETKITIKCVSKPSVVKQVKVTVTSAAARQAAPKQTTGASDKS